MIDLLHSLFPTKKVCRIVKSAPGENVDMVTISWSNLIKSSKNNNL